ncbi:sensor histidine kinase [Nocardioides zeae]
MLEVAARDPERDVDRLISRLTELNERSIATIDALLVLARADQVAPARGPCDLADLVRAALRRLPDGLPAVHLSLSLLPAPVLGVPALLEHLVGNLVENAHRHNVDGGSVIVRTAATAGGARLEVLNTGPVLAPDVVGTLTEPFVRGAGRVRAAGTGLGLAIVASVARVHEGKLVLTAREGGGLHVRLELPAGRPR